MRLAAAAGVSAALALGASRLAAQDETHWVEVLSDSVEVISIDAASVVLLGDSVYRAWERSVSRTSGKVRVLGRADFDCRLRLTRLVAVALPRSQPLPASEVDREWTEILPASRYDAELRQVCSLAGSAGGAR